MCRGGVKLMKNDLQVFSNNELGLEVRTIVNENGSISINAEDTALGFGWVKKESKKSKTYFSVRWATINGFCKDLGFDNKLAKDDYIPESLFYMLGMKASNETAQKYQRWLAMDVIPSIRKTGAYKTDKSEISYIEILQGAKFIADDLKINDGSRMLMYGKVCKSYGVDTTFLPNYTDERITKSATTLLKENNVGINVKKFNILLESCGYLEEKTRPSMKDGAKVKKFKQLTDKGLQYGKNLISPHNQREVQPHYYEDTFMELVDKVLR